MAPSVVHTSGLPELYDTARPDVAVAATVKLVLYGALAGGACVTVMVWFPWFTVSVNDCVAFGSTPLLAVMVNCHGPPVAAVPLNVAVPLPLSVKVPTLPTVNVVELALVTVGAWLTTGGADCPYVLSPQHVSVLLASMPQE